MLKVKIQPLGIYLLSLSLTLIPNSWLLASLEITDSLIPLVETLEKHPSQKYSARYLIKVNKMLEQKDKKIRVVTYNVLFDLFDNPIKDKIHAWSTRLPLVVQSLENMQADILCLQEVYPTQLQDLQKALSNKFKSFVGKSQTGELNVIFYNSDRFELNMKRYSVESTDLSSASLSLPINPLDDPIVSKISGFLPPELEPGKQLTLAHFRDHLTKKEFVVLNTHLTFYRIHSREDQAYFILDLVQKLHQLGELVILAGDFNTLPNTPDRPALPFYDGDHLRKIFQTALQDTKEVALLGHLGPLSSYIKDFRHPVAKPIERTDNAEVIVDHIYISPQICTLIHAIEPCLIQGQYPSDHMPVMVDLLLP